MLEFIGVTVSHVSPRVCMASLLTPMSLAWLSKGKGKDREGKDRQPNGHRFATGSCLGPTVCVVCDKPASGKDLLHCSSW